MFNRLVTSIFWQHIIFPQKPHIVFEQLVGQRKSLGSAPQRNAGNPVLLSGLSLLGGCLCCEFFRRQIVLSTAVLFVLWLLTIELNHILYGFSRGLNINNNLSTYMGQGAWTLLKMTPEGEHQIVWAIILGSLYHRNDFANRKLLMWLISATLVPVSFVLLVTLAIMVEIDNDTRITNSWLLILFTAPIGAGFMVYYSFMQATLTSLLLSTLTALRMPDNFSRQFWFVMVFGGLQLLSFVAIMVVIITFSVNTFALADPFYSILGMILLLFTREIIVRVLLTLLKRNHDIDLLAAARG